MHEYVPQVIEACFICMLNVFNASTHAHAHAHVHLYMQCSYMLHP